MGARPKKVTGRPSSFAADVANEICERLADGDSLRTICKADDMPDLRTVRRWLDRGEHEEETEFSAFRLQYTRAREEQANAYAEMIVEEAFEAKDAAVGRLRMDALKWAASKLAPKKYGDKVALVGGSAGDAPIKSELTVKFV